MTLATRQARTPVQDGYAETIISSRTEIAELSGSAKHLLAGRKSALQPAFFLATVWEKAWIPRVVAIKQGGALIGIVYAKERRIACLPTGIVYADSTLGNMIAAEPIHRGFVLAAAVKALMAARGVCGLRLLVPPDGFELDTIRTALPADQFDYCETGVKNHVAVTLPPSYDEFVESFGPRTRRNLRYYRRHSEKANHVYVEGIPLPEFEQAAYAFLEEGVVGAQVHGIIRAINMFSATDQPLLAGIRDADGKWLSILGGWQESNRAIVFLQMNSDKRCPRASLSLVMRSYLIESLIAKGVSTLLFWAGVGGPIGDCATPLPTVGLHIDSRALAWRAVRGTARSLGARLSGRLAFAAEWISSPSATAAHETELAAPE